jgi:TRAP-type C4-dicarboxylate transport system substrate-binding protein
MISRRAALGGLSAAAATATLGGTLSGALGAPAHAAAPLKISTLAAASSVWGKALKSWASDAAKRSAGAVSLQISYAGAQGDEVRSNQKLKTGQIQGSALSPVGVGGLSRPAQVLQLPGLFSSWDKVDKALTALHPELEKGLADAGMVLVGWAELGEVRLWTRAPVRVPADLPALKIAQISGDPLFERFLRVAGAKGTVVEGSAAAMVTLLQTGSVDGTCLSAAAVEALGLSSAFTHVLDLPVARSVGAVVMSSAAMGALSAGERAALLDAGRAALTALRPRARAEDAAALGRLRARMTVTTPTPEELALWTAAFDATRSACVPGLFAADLVSRVEALR